MCSYQLTRSVVLGKKIDCLYVLPVKKDTGSFADSVQYVEQASFAAGKQNRSLKLIHHRARVSVRYRCLISLLLWPSTLPQSGRSRGSSAVLCVLRGQCFVAAGPSPGKSSLSWATGVLQTFPVLRDCVFL